MNIGILYRQGRIYRVRPDSQTRSSDVGQSHGDTYWYLGLDLPKERLRAIVCMGRLTIVGAVPRVKVLSAVLGQSMISRRWRLGSYPRCILEFQWDPTN